MINNLFYGGELQESDFNKDKGYYWVTSRLVRESGPWYVSESINSPNKVYEMMQEHLDLESCDREYFIAVYLNRKGKVNATSIISIGGLNSSIVHPREVFKPAILTSSASIILVHNHPSGDPAPSDEDIEFTKKLIDAGDIIGIQVLDHIIIGYGRYVSLKEKGVI